VPINAQVPDSLDWPTDSKATKQNREVDDKTDGNGDVNGNIEFLAELQSEQGYANSELHRAHCYAVAEDGKIAVHHNWNLC
jgi:hypothetical protein